eukprot:1334635-Amorphochlora_amoeboformis.AAC.1
MDAEGGDDKPEPAVEGGQEPEPVFKTVCTCLHGQHMPPGPINLIDIFTLPFTCLQDSHKAPLREKHAYFMDHRSPSAIRLLEHTL